MYKVQMNSFYRKPGQALPELAQEIRRDYPIYLRKKSFQTEQENLASYHYRQMSAASFV
jgi:hypothetical protein